MTRLATCLAKAGAEARLRSGSVLVLAAIFVVVILAFTAFSVDVGFILVTKGQLKNACDSAALGAAQDLAAGYSVSSNSPNVSAAERAARQSASSLAGMHATGDRSNIYVDSARDVRLGQAEWDAAAKTWIKRWGVRPYNLVEVTARRNSSDTSAGDGPLNLFFAPVIGHRQASLSVTSTAAVPVGIGIRQPREPSDRVDVLPLALDEPSWLLLMAGVGNDGWTYSESTENVSRGSDRIPELNLYPATSSKLPAGNRGTVDIGNPNNSTSDLRRQIVNGLNEDDLSYFPNNEIRFDNGPVTMGGDTGLSAGIESALESIIGQPRLIPIFRSVTGRGNTVRYEVIKFVGVRLLDVELSGPPGLKRVIVQPAVFSSPAVIRGGGPIATDSYFAAPVLIP